MTTFTTTKVTEILDNYVINLGIQKKNHLGYPYNFAYGQEYQQLIRFFNFTLNNLGCPYTKGNYGLDTRYFEREVIDYFSDLYFLDKNNRWGYVTTSGTEGNLYGILLGRETLPDGKLYFSKDTHYSVAKAARYFRIEAVEVESTINGEIDYQDFKEKLDVNKPAIVNVNLSTTFKGAYDNVETVLEILESKNIKDFYIHCDGALGGMILPFLTKNYPNFTQQIGSLSISGHKFIGCPFPCGIVITAKNLVDNITSSIEYIGSKDTTIGGSRNGHLPLFLWCAISQRKDNFDKEVRDCMEKTIYFYKKLMFKGIPCAMNPFSPIVVFAKPEKEIIEKYQLATLGDEAHVVILQNHTYEILDTFISEIEAGNG